MAQGKIEPRAIRSGLVGGAVAALCAYLLVIQPEFSEVQEHSEPHWYTLRLRSKARTPNILVFADFALYLTSGMP